MQSSIINDSMSPQTLRQTPKSEEDSNKPIFVRIDRFNESKKEFEDIKKTVKEIETTLKKLKDNKSKEDTEIMNWTINLEEVKAKLAEIDSNIFNKL
jgi:septal ring factor EnvC (AmiA/AmiB activator)